MTEAQREILRTAVHRIADAISEAMEVFPAGGEGERTPPAPRQVESTDAYAGLPPVFTVRETTEVLGVGTNSVYEAVRSGRIPSVRIGSRIVVPRMGLVQLLRGEPS